MYIGIQGLYAVSLGHLPCLHIHIDGQLKNDKVRAECICVYCTWLNHVLQHLCMCNGGTKLT